MEKRSGVRSRRSVEAYGWGGVDGNACEGWHLVRTKELSVIEERMPPGTMEVRHWHRSARQFFYVLEGELVMGMEGQAVLLCAGEGLEVGPGVAHQAANRGSADVRFLVVSQPPSHGDRVTEM